MALDSQQQLVRRNAGSVIGHLDHGPACGR